MEQKEVLVSKIDEIWLTSRASVFHDRNAFSQLVLRNQSLVRRFLLNQTLGDEQLSDDLAQETFIKAWLNIGKFKGLSSFSTWLLRIAYNTFYDYRRNMHADYDSLSNSINPTTAEKHSCELRMDIYEALSILSPIERLCISLQCIEGQTLKEITKITSLPEGTVKSHLHRGKEKMASFLKNNGYDR